MLGRVAPATLTHGVSHRMRRHRMGKKGIWTSKYMAPHDSAAKNKGEYDSCVACYFRDEQGNDDDDDNEKWGVYRGDRTVGTVSRRCSPTEQRQRR